MLLLLKAIFLFISIVFFMPMIFFLLIGLFGRGFAVTIERNSWIARTQNRFIKALFHRFIV